MANQFLNQTGVSFLWNKINEKFAEKNTVNQLQTLVNEHESKIDNLQKGTYDDTELRSLINANAEAIEEINDPTNENSVAYKVAEILKDAPANYDTLKEIADWITSDTTGAAGMANDINSLKTLVGDEAVATQISDAIDAALQVEGADKYALAADLNALAARVKTLEDADYQTADQVKGIINAEFIPLSNERIEELIQEATTA